MRLIDADALTKEIKMDIEDVGLQERMIFYRINDAPTVDAVEVVRCKGCEYGQYDCTHMYCDYFGHKVYEDDYCSNAVRRSNAVKRREP